ncbi:PWWP domain-containing protein MUM1 [Platysternon megacephalum]|uniref:PWWP domain-containing protein MUM1 n=1 Tax=Platysternon megacephalum TaxID=55544 RepID=A0A4D9EMH4_9SAUR|nr:PWWP domain-containing protein MUM1 [Platysternon megacephalum]
MASSLNAIFLLLWLLQRGGWQVAGQKVSVKQTPLIQVAFANEEVSMKCLVSYPYMKEYTTFTIHYYWMNSEGKKVTIKNCSVSEAIPTGQMNQTTEKNYPHTIGPTENSPATGTYYCEAKWKSTTETGNGVFILVRDTGYREPSPGTWKFLIALTTILTILSITETALLLWKRKICHLVSCPKLVVCPGRCPDVLQRCPDLSTGAQAPSGSSEPSGSIYTCLESHQAEVYSVLEDNTNSLSLEKNPTATLQDMNISQPDRVEDRNEDCEKTGKKKKKKKEMKSQQETLEEPFDTLYENI